MCSCLEKQDTQNKADKVDLNKGRTEIFPHLQTDSLFTHNYRVLHMPLLTMQGLGVPNTHIRYLFINGNICMSSVCVLQWWQNKKTVPINSVKGTQNIPTEFLMSSLPWGRFGFWFLLYKYKAKVLALLQIKILAPVLTLLKLVPQNPPAQYWHRCKQIHLERSCLQTEV